MSKLELLRVKARKLTPSAIKETFSGLSTYIYFEL